MFCKRECDQIDKGVTKSGDIIYKYGKNLDIEQQIVFVRALNFTDFAHF